MTNEQAIENLKSKMDGSVDTSYEWAETIRIAIEAIRRTSWIPFTDREMTEDEKDIYTMEGTRILNCPLPEDGEDVLISCDGVIYRDVFRKEGDECCFEDEDIYDADAWMPMPKPYKEEEDNART
ncbi:MAG: hypothetical protein IJ703_01395 [Eubacterium sp.]|nr:hypothetical protein [Eubacterium sp.]